MGAGVSVRPAAARISSLLRSGVCLMQTVLPLLLPLLNHRRCCNALPPLQCAPTCCSQTKKGPLSASSACRFALWMSNRTLCATMPLSSLSTDRIAWQAAISCGTCVLATSATCNRAFEKRKAFNACISVFASIRNGTRPNQRHGTSPGEAYRQAAEELHGQAALLILRCIRGPFQLRRHSC